MKITDQLVDAKYAHRTGQEFAGLAHQAARKICLSIVKQQHLSLQNCQSEIVRRRCVIAMKYQCCTGQIEHLEPVLFVDNGVTFALALLSRRCSLVARCATARRFKLETAIERLFCLKVLALIGEIWQKTFCHLPSTPHSRLRFLGLISRPYHFV